jgi:serine/threonine protein kinase
MDPPVGLEDGERVGKQYFSWDWSGRGTTHVDFGRDETLPLQQGKFLGYGIQGGVYETICNGVALAWKKKFCRAEIGPQERKEIEILKGLSHRHIIRLVGTYTQGPFLGLLLWPVATCDLATFLDDVDRLRLRMEIYPSCPAPLDPPQPMDGTSIQRLNALGFDTSYRVGVLYDTTKRLRQSLGCLASAIAYLHQQRIKHKDLKPSNILLSSDGLWVTDFGGSTDFSALTESATQGLERGTPKYFAPEVAAYEPNGRSADIFSLGCIFFEIIALCTGLYSLEYQKDIRTEKNRSFEANLDEIYEWFEDVEVPDVVYMHLMCEVRLMLHLKPQLRPTAQEVEMHLQLIDGFRRDSCDLPLRGSCCGPSSMPAQDVSTDEQWLKPPHVGTCTLLIGNTHQLVRTELYDDRTHFWIFFVRLSRYDIIESVHMFCVRI